MLVSLVDIFHPLFQSHFGHRSPPAALLHILVQTVSVSVPFPYEPRPGRKDTMIYPRGVSSKPTRPGATWPGAPGFAVRPADGAPRHGADPKGSSWTRPRSTRGVGPEKHTRRDLAGSKLNVKEFADSALSSLKRHLATCIDQSKPKFEEPVVSTLY